MKHDNFYKICKRIKDNSPRYSDIEDNAFIEELFREQGDTLPQSFFSDMTRMRLSAETVKKLLSEVSFTEQEEDMAACRLQDMQKLLQTRLEGFSYEERRGVLINLIEKAQEASDTPLNEAERIRMTQSTTQTLENQAITALAALSERLCKMLAAAEGVSESCAFDTENMNGSSGMIIALSGYIRDEEVRGIPEAVGAAAEASVYTGKVYDPEDTSALSEIVDYCLPVIVYSFVISLFLTFFLSTVTCGILLKKLIHVLNLYLIGVAVTAGAVVYTKAVLAVFGPRRADLSAEEEEWGLLENEEEDEEDMEDVFETV